MGYDGQIYSQQIFASVLQFPGYASNFPTIQVAAGDHWWSHYWRTVTLMFSYSVVHYLRCMQEWVAFVTSSHLSRIRRSPPDYDIVLSILSLTLEPCVNVPSWISPEKLSLTWWHVFEVRTVADPGFLQGGCGSWCVWSAPSPFMPSLPPTLKKILWELAAGQGKNW